jgi:hypothetical protein
MWDPNNRKYRCWSGISEQGIDWHAVNRGRKYGIRGVGPMRKVENRVEGDVFTVTARREFEKKGDF